MGMLFDLLPFMDNWKWISVDIEDEVIQGGSSYDVIFEQYEKGWFVDANASFHGDGVENAEVSLKVDDLYVEKTFEQLYEAGYTQRGISWIYLYRYDLADNVCSIGFDAGYPLPYNSLLRFKVTTPPGVQLNIDTATFGRLTIKKSRMDQFKTQLKELLGSQTISKVLYGKEDVRKKIKKLEPDDKIDVLMEEFGLTEEEARELI